MPTKPAPISPPTTAVDVEPTRGRGSSARQGARARKHVANDKSAGHTSEVNAVTKLSVAPPRHPETTTSGSSSSVTQVQHNTLVTHIDSTATIEDVVRSRESIASLLNPTDRLDNSATPIIQSQLQTRTNDVAADSSVSIEANIPNAGATDPVSEDAAPDARRDGILSSAADVDVTTTTSTASGLSIAAVRLSVAVRDLKPTIADAWVLVGQVVSRGAVRKWDNLRGSGQLLDCLIVDSGGDTIKATIFNQGVDMFGGVLQNGAVCSFAGGKVKVPNRSFSSAAHELTFDQRSSIALVPAVDAPTFAGVSIGMCVRDLYKVASGEIVSVVGIMTRADASKRITTTKGKDCWKRDVLVLDDSMCKVIWTIWGTRAREELSQHEGEPVLIERGTVNDYQGMRSINVGVGAVIHFGPTHPESTRLRSWYVNAPNEDTFPFVGVPVQNS